MTYISKCHGNKCPLKEHCRRFTDKASSYQSYIIPPYKVRDGVFSCAMFWGEAQDGILNQLKDIVSGKLNS